MSFSEEVRKNYIASGGVWCPKCGSSELGPDGDPKIQGQTKIIITVKCRDKHCDAVWNEVFILTDIKEKK